MTTTHSQEHRIISTHRVSNGQLTYARTAQGQWIVLLRTEGSDHLLGATTTPGMEQPSR
ncbi:hypothetical protein [Kocuria sp. CCUG 69068]|uniref:hypothetical protein n=1 Tax=Kocuria sp. CCUG 69068 TaxID=2043138 RepID=UPI001E2E2F9C